VLTVPSINAAGMSLDPMRTHQGGNSGFQAANLAILMGAARILLLGFDMRAAGGRKHWHEDHPDWMVNPQESTFRSWREAFEVALPSIQRAGVEIINCTPGSALTCFPMAEIESFHAAPIPR
jgi:hypothetical protein